MAGAIRKDQERQQKGQDHFGNVAGYTAFLVPEESSFEIRGLGLRSGHASKYK